MRIQNIVVTGRLYKEIEKLISNFPGKCFRFLPEEAVDAETLQWADAYVGFRPVDNFEFNNIKWVHSLGAGVDSFLRNREWKPDVLLTRTRGEFGAKISEYCLSYILSHLQHHDEFHTNQDQSRWVRLEPISLQSQKIMIFGTGNIAQEIARKLSFFGVDVIGVSFTGAAKTHFAQTINLAGVEEKLKEVDWIINTLPLTKETEGIFNDDIFGCLKGCCFINVGRGATVESKALIKALAEGKIQLAVLDVFEVEPLPDTSVLWRIPNVIITPHIAAVTSPEEAVREFVDTMKQIEEGRFSLENQVDWARGY